MTVVTAMLQIAPGACVVNKIQDLDRCKIEYGVPNVKQGIFSLFSTPVVLLSAGCSKVNSAALVQSPV